jgi:CHAD domain-containing protein
MAYRFKLDESFEKGFRRIAREQLDRALSELSPLEVGPREVHESRKALKRLRALLRLVGPSLGLKHAARRNAALRDAARLLSTRRDEVVLISTIERLEASADPATKAASQALRDALRNSAGNLTRPLDSDTAQQARLLLVKEARHFAKASLKIRGFECVRPGLYKSYRKARRGFKAAYRNPTDEAFHELRKAVQWHWRQMALLSRAWPEVFEARIAAARELSQILGDDHDLAILALAASKLEGFPEHFKSALARACAREQEILRRDAEFRVSRLFAEPAGAFCRRIEIYWAASRKIKSRVEVKVAKSGPTDPFTGSGAPRAAGQIAAIPPATAPSQRRA